MGKMHYVIRKNDKAVGYFEGEEKYEQVFAGTSKEAIELQEKWGTDEENIKNYDTFEELMEDDFFGQYEEYKEVSKEDYEALGKAITTEEKEKIWNRA